MCSSLQDHSSLGVLLGLRRRRRELHPRPAVNLAPSLLMAFASFLPCLMSASSAGLVLWHQPRVATLTPPGFFFFRVADFFFASMLTELKLRSSAKGTLVGRDWERARWK